ncbi:MAG TPA: glycosyltransferase [Actinomycetota bacterium]|nr:glycosyltransferase [Actinomycetota bacterium]
MALVAARDEADRVGATVQALRSIAHVTEVVVVDDGSMDGTASEALAAGAGVLRLSRPVGKGGALEGALRRLAEPDVWLLADADLGATAADLARVLEPVLEGRADLAIAAFPPGEGGGFGIVKRFAARSIGLVCGFVPGEPLSGQRAATAATIAACRPLARGFGVETAMTIDAVRAGLRVLEVAAALEHRATGRDARGFAHRGRQGLDILLAVLARTLGLR